MNVRKILEKILGGSLNIGFRDFRRVVEAYGFHLSRIRGSHHIFVHANIEEIVNLQEVNGKAKPYQIRQFLKLVEEYNLKLKDES